MATTKKKTKRKPAAPSAAKKSAKRPAKKPAKKAVKKKTAAKSPPKPAAGPRRRAKGGAKETEVERRWREYLQHRTELEQAVIACREAEERLSAARDLERTRRTAFNSAKSSLQELLEVESAGGDGGSSRRLLEFTPPEPEPILGDEPPTI